MRYLAFLAVLALFLVGCQEMTPEQRAKADAAKAAFNEAAATAEKAKAIMAAHVQEFNAIKIRVDAGESIPAVLVSRYAELSQLIAKDVIDVQDAVTKFNAAKKANDEAAAAGVAWYNRVDWWTVGKVAAGIAVGVASVYFPLAAPAAKAAQAGIVAVAAVNAKDPAAGQAIKDAVLEASRALGVEAKMDALVQKYDPPLKSV